MNEEILLLLRVLMRSGRTAEAKLDGLLDEADLSATKLLALQHIAQSNEALSLGQLAMCLAFVKSNATQLIDHLEEDRLVKRVPAPNDRRCTLLELTEDGEERYEAALQMIEPLMAKLEALYTPDERAQLLMLLQRLSDKSCS